MTGLELAPAGMFQHATGVVQAVLIVLLLCSVLCWAVILEKAVLLIRLSRDARSLDAATAKARSGIDPAAHVAQAIVAAGRDEWGATKPDESTAERRQRVEDAMHDAMVEALFKAEARLPYLATIGSSAPFIGLFGTVWGIMHAFSAIAQANNTSLAVVAPGIAEALSTTAVGLGAAIPASIAYNKLASDFGGLARRFNLAIGRLVRRADEPGSIVGGPA